MNLASVYEKLGAFYLGKTYDLHQGQRQEELLLYDSKDLLTHAVIVGMTGSGKTGLGVGLLEEAAIDGIPALVVDPKGDLANLLLTFPELRPADFAPWVHASDADRQGISVEQLAAQMAERWGKGLAEWGQDGQRIARLRKAAEFKVYTPGSDAGTPISILSSFAAPPAAVLEDQDLFRDRVGTTATSLLSLLGIDTDPLRSREHILLTNILLTMWQRNEDLDLGTLIHRVQDPPFDRVGVIDLEAFFPKKERFELSMRLNNLLAAPSFATWLSGESLDIDRLLYTAHGTPRIAIFSIAHLSDAERMFFVSLLLNQTLGWIRSRPGTNSLRALLYIDELFGYMPPVAEPPSKKPLLTLLKQARAYGLGLVLATQNPVDLDYKGLSNTGTWFIGRLQTERDKDRVLDGLAGASAESGETLDRAALSQLLSKVGKRVFLMHNVHEDEPTVFETRWTLSYLAGPMTRNQIRELHALGESKAAPPSSEVTRPADIEPLPSSTVPAQSQRPVISPEIPQQFLALDDPSSATSFVTAYQPCLLAEANVHYVDTRKRLSTQRSLQLLLPISVESKEVDWGAARTLEADRLRWVDDPSPGIEFLPLPPSATLPDEYKRWTKSLDDYLYHHSRFPLFHSPELDVYSEPGESERDFRIRLAERAREERDDQVDSLRQRYAAKLRTLDEQIARAEHAVDREQSQADSARSDSVVNLGTSILNAILGRKKLSSTNIGRARSAARKFEYANQQAKDVELAKRKLAGYEDERVDLEMQIANEMDAIRDRLNPATLRLETFELKPRRTDIAISRLALAWVPKRQDVT